MVGWFIGSCPDAIDVCTESIGCFHLCRTSLLAAFPCAGTKPTRRPPISNAKQGRCASIGDGTQAGVITACAAWGALRTSEAG